MKYINRISVEGKKNNLQVIIQGYKDVALLLTLYMYVEKKNRTFGCSISLILVDNFDKILMRTHNLMF